MSVFLLCERAIGLVWGKRLVLSSGERSLREDLNYEGLAGAHSQDETVACARHFSFVRDRLLKLHPWVFARRTAAPARRTDAVAGWDYAFALPTDCLKVLAVVEGGMALTHFEIVDGELLCNYETVHLRYTAKVTDTSKWDPAFEDAFCAALAGEIAAAVTVNAQTISLMEQRAQMAIQDGYRTGAIRGETGLPVRTERWLDYCGLPAEFDKAPWGVLR